MNYKVSTSIFISMRTICILLFLFAAILQTAQAQIGASGGVKNAVINLNDHNGRMKPKVGWLLVPNENIPDGRIIPLNTRIVRDDMDFQNLSCNHAVYGGNPVALQDIAGDAEHSRLVRMKTAAERLVPLNIALYPITAYLPTWASINGLSVAPIKDFDAWAQWVRDVAQFIKDNDLPIEELNVYNENWQIKVPDYNKMHELAWHAFKEVLPDVRLGGPSPDNPNFEIVTSLIDHCVNVGIPIDILAWHFCKPDGIDSFQKPRIDYPITHVDYNYVGVGAFQRQLRDYMAKYPQLGQPKYYHEEWSFFMFEQGASFEYIAANDVADVDETVLAIWQDNNGLSDMILSNPSIDIMAQRRKIWWMMAAYGNMDGMRVKKTGDISWVASVNEEKGEAKILTGGQKLGKVDFTLDNPFPRSHLRIEKYRIVGIKTDGSPDTGPENEGIKFQSAESVRSSGKQLSVSIDFEPMDVWLIVVKKIKSMPSDFMLMAPDDNTVALASPTFTWQKAQGADSYTLTISKNKDLSKPVYTKKGIQGESFTIDAALPLDERYYWSVSAVNKYGKRPPLNNVYYTFTAKNNLNVPGAFTLFHILDGAYLTALKPNVNWSKSKDADRYHIYISKTADFAGNDLRIYTVDKPDTLFLNKHTKFYWYLTEALEPQTTYFIKMTAENSAGIREMTGAPHKFTTTTADGTPSAFSLLNKNDTFNQRNTLRWNFSYGAFFYHLEIATDSSFSNIVLNRPTITVPAYTMEDSIVEAGRTYFWRVRASSRDGQKTTINSDGAGRFTVSQRPTPPITKVAYPSNEGLTVMFNPVANADSYTVYYGTASGKYTGHITVPANTDKAIVPVKKSGRYYVSVTATRNGLESEKWNETTCLVNYEL